MAVQVALRRGEGTLNAGLASVVDLNDGLSVFVSLVFVVLLVLAALVAALAGCGDTAP